MNNKTIARELVALAGKLVEAKRAKIPSDWAHSTMNQRQGHPAFRFGQNFDF